MNVRVALIGAGRVAEWGHLPAWSDRADAGLAVVVEADARRRDEVAQRWQVPERAGDYRPLLERADIHAVDICLPNDLHAPVAEAFLLRGKHVLVEKPIATAIGDVRRLADAARRGGAVLMVAENWLFASSARRAKRLLDEGALGEVFLAKTHHEGGFYVEREKDPRRWMSDAARAGGGYLIDAGIHAISLVRHLLGEFASVSAYAAPGVPPEALEEDVALSARLASGALASMHFTGRSRHLGERRLGVRLFGTRGIAELDIWSGRFSSTVQGVRTSVEEQGFSRGFRELVDHFLECVASGAEPLTSARRQIGSLATVLAAYRSAREGRSFDPAELLREP
ncbi:MAG: Gfo/Idh/MocA family protein [Betaproteobacteria bacterium]